MTKPELSIIIPCYNEEKNIEILAKEFSKVIGKKNIELILVNNGSTDSSKEVLKKLEKKYLFLKTVVVKKNIGYGFGIYSGLKNASGEYLCWTHADLQTPPKDVITALEIALKHTNPKNIFVKGKRKGRNIVDIFFTIGMSTFCSVVLGKKLTDINAQPNLFHSSFLKKMVNPPKDFSFDLYALYLAKKQKIAVIRFPVEFGNRLHGKSSWNFSFGSKMKFIKRTIDFTLKLRESMGD